KPMPIQSGSKRPLSGTFVPSAKESPLGIEEARDILWGPDGNLYVADRNADAVKVYDGRTGGYLGSIGQVDKPIHLLLSPDAARLLIGSGGSDSVVQYDLQRKQLTT